MKKAQLAQLKQAQLTARDFCKTCSRQCHPMYCHNPPRQQDAYVLQAIANNEPILFNNRTRVQFVRFFLNGMIEVNGQNRTVTTKGHEWLSQLPT